MSSAQKSKGTPVRYLVFVLWIGALFFLSAAPFDVKLQLKTMGRLHNAGHFVAFMVAALLLAAGKLSLRSRLLRCFFVLAFAASLEWLEEVLYHNSFEWRDLLIDTLGIGVALLITQRSNATIDRKPRVL